jgi:hypothetical protein
MNIEKAAEKLASTIIVSQCRDEFDMYKIVEKVKQALRAAQDDMTEECARKCEILGRSWIAKELRALKSNPEVKP